MLAYAFDSFAVGGALTFASRGGAVAAEVEADGLVAAGREPVVALTRSPAAETAERVTVGFVRAEQDYLPGAVEALAPDAAEPRTRADLRADRALRGRGEGDRRTGAERGTHCARQPGLRPAAVAARGDAGRPSVGAWR